MTQTIQVLQMLKRGPVTPQQALYSVGCMRLAARINDLRNQGHTILTDMVEDGGKRYARYRLVTGKRRSA